MVDKQRILIVDDDENIAELISLYLMKECYDTKIVGDGESALKEVPVFKPNLILLDLMLPGIDGYQVCRELEVPPRCQSSCSPPRARFDKVLGLELGADDYMIKPFDSKELVARVKAVLRRYQAAPVNISAATNSRANMWSIEPDRQPDELSSIKAIRSTCRQRSWNSYISLLPPRIRSSPVSSFSTISGDMNTSATRGP